MPPSVQLLKKIAGDKACWFRSWLEAKSNKPIKNINDLHDLYELFLKEDFFKVQKSTQE